MPDETAALALFRSDRTCCVCREDNKAIQIHHIDETPTNHDQDNLAVLCLECHDRTQVRGGFGRTLTADQVLLYRKDWHEAVESRRALGMPPGPATPRAPNAGERVAHDRDVFNRARGVMSEADLDRCLERLWNADEYRGSEHIPLMAFARLLRAADNEFLDRCVSTIVRQPLLAFSEPARGPWPARAA